MGLPAFKIGTEVGPYILVEEIGYGGIGTVFKARHKLLDHVVAVKVHQYFPENELVGIAFKQSASYLAQMNHPNIVRLPDYVRIPALYRDRHNAGICS